MLFIMSEVMFESKMRESWEASSYTSVTMDSLLRKSDIWKVPWESDVLTMDVQWYAKLQKIKYKK